MQLTRFTDYSLRVLIYLCVHKDTRCTINDIAIWHNISKQHLVKIVHQLTKLGYVKSTQGRGGGLTLAIEPKDIEIGKLVRETETDFHIVECFQKDNNNCRLNNNCKLKNVFYEAQKAFLAVLDKYTLDMLVHSDFIKGLSTE